MADNKQHILIMKIVTPAYMKRNNTCLLLQHQIHLNQIKKKNREMHLQLLLVNNKNK